MKHPLSEDCFLTADFPTQFLARAAEIEDKDLPLTEFETRLRAAEPFPSAWKVYVFRCHMEFAKRLYRSSGPERAMLGEQVAGETIQIARRAAQREGTPILATIPVVDDGVSGSLPLVDSASVVQQSLQFNQTLTRMAEEDGFAVIDVAGEFGRMGLERAFHAGIYYSTRLPWSLDLVQRMADVMTKHASAAAGDIKKCLILDCDNTLWGGVIGDDGMGKIEIGELGNGRIFSDIQQWAKNLKERGIILAVCSKNEEANAKEPFEQHPEMVLRLEDIAVFVANWQGKDQNIKYIQSILNIGMDAMVFLDDNAHEREWVRSQIPALCVPELPNDPSLWLPFLRNEGLFETASTTRVDSARTQLYQHADVRAKEAEVFENEEGFLESLELKAEIKALDAYSIPRAAQLTQRTNQFNMRTVRYSEQDLEAMREDKAWECFTVSLSDRIGDYGIVALCLIRIDGLDAFLDTWLMSCRVFGKTLEHFTCNEAMQRAGARGCKRLCGEHIPTKKNGLISGLYESFGFVFDGAQWRADVDGWKELPTFVARAKDRP